MDQKMYSIGVQATNRLAEIIDGDRENKLQIAIDPVLVARNSTNNPNK